VYCNKFRFLYLWAGVALVACTDPSSVAQTAQEPKPQIAPQQVMRSFGPGQGVRLTREPCVGSYYSDRLSGDFAGYIKLERFIEQMVNEHGFEREYLLGLFSQAKRKDWTLNYFARSDKRSKKPLSPGSWSRYRAKFLGQERIGRAVAFGRRHKTALTQASEEYGVPGEYILGIMAVETSFGKHLGTHRVLDALTTLGFDYARRGAFFRDELRQFLLMARSEKLDPSTPKGSFAGAMGLGQFMPSSFRKWAVDFNRDGHRNLWDPEDTIGSIANYFVQHGWQSGKPVVAPLRIKKPVPLKVGCNTRYSVRSLQQAGLGFAQSLQTKDALCLLRLRYYKTDQYLIGYPNFYTITRYNRSTHYAMAVHELAQVIRQKL